MGYVDLHSHVLPGIDDGARAIADSKEMVALLGEIGFEVIHATPHQKVGSFVPSREEIDGAHANLAAELATGSANLRLGAENMWDELFLERSLSGTIPGYRAAGEGEPRRAFLFELPTAFLPPRLEEHLFSIQRSSKSLPVMAHPERYAPLWSDHGRYERLAQRVALVVDLAALDGAHGAPQCKAARWLVEERLAHAAASDIHQASDARAAASGIAWIRKKMGESAVTRLLDDGPRQILNGELPD